MRRSTPALPWLTPGTASTWMCPRGHINSRKTTTCPCTSDQARSQQQGGAS